VKTKGIDMRIGAYGPYADTLYRRITTDTPMRRIGVHSQ